MTHLPPLDSFLASADGYDWRPFTANSSATRSRQCRPSDDWIAAARAFYFESVIGGERVGRYSLIAGQPFLEIHAHGDRVTVISEDGQRESHQAADPLEFLRERIASLRLAPCPDLPPFVGGAVGYAAYDVVRYVENLPDCPEDDRGIADLSFGFYDRVVVFDHITKTVFAIALARLDRFESAEAARRDAEQRVDAWVERLQRPEPQSLRLADINARHEIEAETTSNFTQTRFEDAVRRCVEYIEAGDIFQVVISQRLETRADCDPFEIYRTLRVINPSPFMFFVRTPEATLVGASPEIMCRVTDRRVTVRPLAGTRRRGATQEEDRSLADELLADPKERAEHVMLVDLGRNDVGRVSKFGTVALSDVMQIERYSHVMHITSNVDGELRDECDAFDALRACLPAGTVSGAPKVRAMQIIDELEPHKRGPYAGAVGHIDFRGNMDTCIALRTLVIQGDTAYIQAGAGIVADSSPSAEYAETLNKARGLLKAVALTRVRAESQRQA